jgi:hypothetical protein
VGLTGWRRASTATALGCCVVDHPGGVDVVLDQLDQLDRVHERIAGRFTRSERKNGWTLAEQAGEMSPDGMQRLLRWADWDIDGVRGDVRDYVIEHLGAPGGVLIVDDTGFLKKGVRSARVQRQYSGTAGRIENCQIGTFLAYASERGHALIGRALYLPEPWIADPSRCRRAGIPDRAEFETKPRQAMAMLSRAFAAGAPFAWITADEAYGQVKYLRAWLEDQDVAYVLATKVNDLLTTTSGAEARADELIEQLPGAGVAAAVGRRWCARATRVRLGADHARDRLAGRAWAWLLARRSLSDPTEIACYVCYGPRRSTLLDLAWIAGTCRRIEECFRQG